MIHPFLKKDFEAVIHETVFFSYITYKINEKKYETFIFDIENKGEILPIFKIIQEEKDKEYGFKNLSIITYNKHKTELLWEELDFKAKELVNEFGSFVSKKNETLNCSMEDWLIRIKEKLGV